MFVGVFCRFPVKTAVYCRLKTVCGDAFCVFQGKTAVYCRSPWDSLSTFLTIVFLPPFESQKRCQESAGGRGDAHEVRAPRARDSKGGGVPWARFEVHLRCAWYAR